MRFTAKQLANIAVVTVIGLVATAWAVFGLAHVRFDKPKIVRVQLASSGGALPGAEVTSHVPPIISTRSLMASIPKWSPPATFDSPGWNPTPSSWTSNTTAPSSRPSTTRACFARACFTTFCRASCDTR